ncbi:MAG: HemK family protein methyltransferase [Patescibacteria group bacterium]
MNKETKWLLQEKYHGVETSEFCVDVTQLTAGLPLAYAIGWVSFLGCHIDLSLHPFIPRPETEFWVKQAIEEIVNRQSPVAGKKNQMKILDLFSGSGCVGIALAKHLSGARVDFGEKDRRFCKQIGKNLMLNNIDASRVRIIKTDVFSHIADSYDFIFANPPYIDPTKKDTVQDSVLAYEPHESLFASDGGLQFIKKLLAEEGAHLKQKGAMYIEFGNGQKEAIAQFARTLGRKNEFQKDQFGEWRIVKITT